MAESAIRMRVREDRTATITFDMPERSTNILTLAMWQDFEAALRLLQRQTDIRGLILKSAKKDVFIAGADLKLLAEAKVQDPDVHKVIQQGHRVLRFLESLPLPTCAVIDGAALGGGLEVALACDMILLGSNRKVELGLPEVKLGLMPGWGGTQRLPRLIGLLVATELISTGRTLNAVQAAEIDLAIGPIDSAGLLDSASKILKLEGWQAVRKQKYDWIPEDVRNAFHPDLTSATPAVREAVQAILSGAELPLPEAINRETEGFFRLVGTAETKKLIGDFFARRK